MAKLPIISKLFPSYRWKVTALIVCGVLVGSGGLFMYLLRAHTYLGDDPAACVNCHIMAPYYATWMHSSHSRDATCNDCHVPHENMVKMLYILIIAQLAVYCNAICLQKVYRLTFSGRFGIIKINEKVI